MTRQEPGGRIRLLRRQESNKLDFMHKARKHSKACRKTSKATHPGKLRVRVSRLQPNVIRAIEGLICAAAVINFFHGANRIFLVDIQAALRAGGMGASLPTIGKEAYRMGLQPATGARPGKRAAGVPGRGKAIRPTKLRSPHRAPALKLAAEGKKPAAIAEELGIRRQAVERLIKTARRDTKPDNGDGGNVAGQ